MQRIENGVGREQMVFWRAPKDAVTSPRSSEVERMHILQYLAGYCDMSLGFSITEDLRIGKRSSSIGFGLRMDLARVHPEAVNLMKTTYPAQEYIETLASDKKVNRWYAQGDEAVAVFDDLSPLFRLKAGHVAVVNKFLDAELNVEEESMQNLRDQLRELKKSPHPDFSLPFTDAYLAGVIDAHSYIKLIRDKRGVVRLQMRIDPGNKAFATEIVKQYTNKNPDKHKKTLERGYIVFASQDVYNVLKRISPHLMVYKEIASLGMQYHENPSLQLLDKFNEAFEKVRRRKGWPQKKAA